VEDFSIAGVEEKEDRVDLKVQSAIGDQQLIAWE
jgi:hypothetical protein